MRIAIFKVNELLTSQSNPRVESVLDAIAEKITSNSLVIGFGNGGSSSDIEHFIGELLGKFKSADRVSIPAISLTQPMSAVSAIANDFGYEYVFKRPLEAFLRLQTQSFVIFALSTSGTSKNVIEALKYVLNLKANNTNYQQNIFVVFLTSTKNLNTIQNIFKDNIRYLDILLCIDETDTDIIQTGHYILLHKLCDKLEKREDLKIQKLQQ